MRETPRDSSSSLTVEPGFAFRKDLWTRAYQVNEYGYLRWSDVSFEDTKSERNITSATGSVAPGQIVSLWGPVDSGVDVLAQILAGISPNSLSYLNSELPIESFTRKQTVMR